MECIRSAEESEMRTTLAEQKKRRRRILDAAASIARRKGYGAFTMSAVAENSGAAVGTIYRYFPSKPLLLLSLLDRELDRLDRITQAVPADADPYQQLWHVIAWLNARMVRDPRFAGALAQSFMTVYAEGRDADPTLRRLKGIFASVIGGQGPTQIQQKMSWMVVDVWATNANAWLNHRASLGDINLRVQTMLRSFAGVEGFQQAAATLPGTV
jgi:TetR/AcrR family transcriptional regulator, cholesterol catabolism regulator